MINAYPQYANVIVQAGNSLDGLREALEKIKALEKEKYLKDSKAEAKSLVDNVIEAQKKLAALKLRQKDQTAGMDLSTMVGVDDAAIQKLNNDIHQSALNNYPYNQIRKHSTDYAQGRFHILQ